MRDGLPIADAGPALAALGASLGFSFFVFVPLLFPTGRPLTLRWRPAVWLALVGIGLSTIGSTLRPDSPGVEAPLVNPLGVQSLASVAKVIEGVGSGCWATAAVLGVLSAILRFRRSNGAERSQLKWVVYAFVLMPVLILGANLATDAPFVGIPLVLAGSGAVPGAIALAILRYRLYDIDRLVNRTLVYAGVSGVLALAYVGPVLLAQLLLPGEDRPAGVVAVSTLGAAALFQPARRRVQRWVDRRFYRERYDADRTVNAFAARLRENVDLATLNDDLLGVVRRTMQPDRAVLWLRP